MNVVYVFVLIVENRMNVKYVTNVIHVPKTVQKANVLVGHLKSNLAFKGGVLCGRYFLSIQTDQSVH